ncbi:transposase [Chryseobacterium sp. YIM B08800]|uniref:transposase n=1 Tax=Chryseobacterium sp. YIM B08800 TaxID=2984136 RepID=UPI003A0FDCD7
MDGRKFQRQYKQSISGFKDWEQKSHTEDWIIYPENISEQLSLYEVALSDGELYTVLTSKKAKRTKESFKRTRSEKEIENLLKINRRLMLHVKEITLDMAGSMKLIVKRCFPNAIQIIDRCHVQKLTMEALQEIKISHRWKAIDQENTLLVEAKEKKKKKLL